MIAQASVRPRAGFAIFTLAMIAVFVGLGLWQLQRRAEKHALIAALNERLADSPQPLPLAAEWSLLTPAHDEFRRVRFTATYQPGPDAMVYSSGSALRADVSGPGTWAFLPARVPTGQTVVINTGFVQNTMQDRAEEDRVVAPLISRQPVPLTGYIRFPETAGLLTPAPNVAKRLWFYIDLEGPVPASGIPKPGPLDVHLKDDHLQYAITWFALAAAVAIAFGLWLRGRRLTGSK